MKTQRQMVLVPFLVMFVAGVGRAQSPQAVPLAPAATAKGNPLPLAGVFTPDSQTFLAAGGDGFIRAFKVQDGTLLYTLARHKSSISHLGLSGDKLLISGGDDGTVFLWDLAERKKIAELLLPRPTIALRCLAVSPDGKLLACGSDRKEPKSYDLSVWDLAKRAQVASLPGHRFCVVGLAFAPDGRALAAADAAGDVKRWDLATRKATTFHQHPYAKAVQFSPDGKWLALGDSGGGITLYDAATLNEEALVRPGWREISSLAYAPRGRILASAGQDGVRLWNPFDLEDQPPLHLAAHKGRAVLVAFAPDGKTLATAGIDRVLHFWSITPALEKCLQPSPGLKPAPEKTVTRSCPVRLAILAPQGIEVSRNVQELALVKLSSEQGIQLLERATVERLLQEQKLSLSGLVEAATLVQAGKILAVDLLGVIEGSAVAKENFGFLVFDAATGVRLVDEGFSSSDQEQQARAAAAGVCAAVQKWRAGTKHLKTVCFLPVRNADLPRFRDAFCETLSALLERQLVQNPAIVTLERQRLEAVTKEKTLATEAATRELLASVLQVEMEMARARKGDGLRATVTIRDSAGKALHKITHEVADPNGADLVGPLTKRVQEALQTTKGQGNVKRNREARRFLREAVVLWKHKHFPQGLHAAEAAYALKTDEDAELLLAEYLFLSAWESWRPGSVGAARYAATHFEATPEKVRAGLDLARRAQQLIDFAKGRGVRTADHFNEWRFAGTRAWFQAESSLQRELRYLKVQPADPSTEQELRAFRNLCVRRLQGRVREFAQSLRLSGHQWATARLTAALPDYIEQMQSCLPDSAVLAEAVREALSLWLDVSQSSPAETFPLLTVPSFAEGALRGVYYTYCDESNYTPADREQMLSVLQAMQEHPHPVFGLYAAHYTTKNLLRLKRISRAEADQRYRQTIAEAKRWIDRAPFKAPDLHRVAFYEFWDKSVRDFHSSGSYPRDMKAQREDYVALVNFMLERGDVVFTPWKNAAPRFTYFKEDHATGLPLIRRMLAARAAPQLRLLYDPSQWIRPELERQEWAILKMSPQLAKVRPILPWDKVVPLAECGDFPQGNSLMAPTRHGQQVYLATGGIDPARRQPYLQLVRTSLNGGLPQLLGKAFVTVKDFDPKKTKHIFWSLPRFVTQCVIHGDYFYAGTLSDGIYAFSLKGGDGVRLGDKEGLPALAVVALTALEGKLVALLEDGYIVVYDLVSNRCDVIASSRRREELSPFDNRKPYRAYDVIADPERHRVLFGIFPDRFAHPQSGLWEYSLQTRQFKKLLSLIHFRPSAVQNSSVYLQATGDDWIVKFELAGNKVTLLQGKCPEGIEQQAPAGLPRDFSAAFPDQLYHGGYVWKRVPFSRQPLRGGEVMLLPHVTQRSVYVGVTECLEAVNRDELLVGDAQVLYLVRLKND